MKTALIIGSRSDIAVSVQHKLSHNYQLINVDRTVVDLCDFNSDSRLRDLLTQHSPDVIINCAGVFGDNTVDYATVMDVNLRSNWSVIKYYIDNPPDKTVKFVMIGSSTHNQGRKNYILYAASKGALYRMWQGASEFVSSNFLLGLINPVRVNTKMVSHLQHSTPDLCLEAEDVANQIVSMCNHMTVSESFEMGYKTKEQI